MKYNISDSPLKLREYGRNVQSMVEYAKTIEDRDRRTRVIKEIVRIMVNLHPEIKDQPDYEEKLWDHLYLIADFDLDIDSPFPMPDPEEAFKKPDVRMTYHRPKTRFKQYGKNVELLIQKATELEDGEFKTRFINYIATIMRQFAQQISKDAAQEVVIAAQINEISKGKFNLKPEDLTINKVSGKLKLPNEMRIAQEKKRNSKNRKSNRKKSSSHQSSNSRKKKR
jgi:hypothetical protein